MPNGTELYSYTLKYKQGKNYGYWCYPPSKALVNKPAQKFGNCKVAQWKDEVVTCKKCDKGYRLSTTENGSRKMKSMLRVLTGALRARFGQ